MNSNHISCYPQRQRAPSVKYSTILTPTVVLILMMGMYFIPHKCTKLLMPLPVYPKMNIKTNMKTFFHNSPLSKRWGLTCKWTVFSFQKISEDRVRRRDHPLSNLNICSKISYIIEIVDLKLTS